MGPELFLGEIRRHHNSSLHLRQRRRRRGRKVPDLMLFSQRMSYLGAHAGCRESCKAVLSKKPRFFRWSGFCAPLTYLASHTRADMLTEETKTGPEMTPGGNIAKWFQDFLDLREGSDREGAVQSISSGKLMRGSNAWMLVCSIMIASLGLNLNSGAVIIGAMLISPLMNPILGVGLGIGTNDRDMLWQSLVNFGVSIIIALVTSIIYFSLTPIDVFTDEMSARTEPTILDGLVAVFGGLAGIISITRKDKTNAIPGVAIATALMPPLCVAGYGIVLAFTSPGHGLSVFWRAGYLFFLNSFFIAITAYVIIRLLRFPYRKYVNAKEKRRSQLIIGAVSLLMILPGIFVLKGVIFQQRQEKAAREFTARYFPSSNSTYLLNRDNQNEPLLIYPLKDRLLDKDSLDYYTHILQDSFNLTGARIVTDTSITASELAGIQGKLTKMGTLTERVQGVEQRVADVALRQAEINRALESANSDSTRFNNLRRSLELAFPGVESAYFAEIAANDSLGGYLLAAIRRSWPGRRPAVTVARAERERMQQFLQHESQADSLVLVVEEL